MLWLSMTAMVNVGIEPDATCGSGKKVCVYRLGGHRFDEWLSAETEEAIRGPAYSVINNLRDEEFAVGMLSVSTHSNQPTLCHDDGKRI